MAPYLHCVRGDTTLLPDSIPKPLHDQVLAYTRLNETEVKTLYDRFRRLAPAGSLALEQFQQAMGILGVIDDAFIAKRMFRAFDANADGLLDFFEFANSLAIMLRGTDSEKLTLSFKMIAGTPDGITFEDFRSLLNACSTTMTTLLDGAFRHQASDSEARHLFSKLVDVNRCSAGLDESSTDGIHHKAPMISLEAFKAAARHNQEFLRFLGLGDSLPSKLTKARYLVGLQPEDVDTLRMHVGNLRQIILTQEQGTENSGRSKQSSSSGVECGMGSTLLPRLIDSLLPIFSSTWCCCSQNSTGASIDEGSWSLEPHVPPDPAEGVAASSEIVRKELDNLWEWCQAHSGDDGLALPNHTGVQTSASSSMSVAPNDPARARGKWVLAPHSGALERAHTLLQRSRIRAHKLLGPRGLAIHFGHENWDLVIDMMLGIRMAIGRTQQEIARDIVPIDFNMKEKFSIAPLLPSHAPNVAFSRFKDYAPIVFARLRASMGISSEAYARSFGPEQLLGNMLLGNLSALSELSSEGKSGAFFYYTADGRYILKTMSRKEHRCLKAMLKFYYRYITENPHTLLVRFLGVHSLSMRENAFGWSKKPRAGKKLYFVVMANLFSTPVEIHRSYDLKGSWVGRRTLGPTRPGDALKDGDFEEVGERLNIGKEQRERILKQIEGDTRFLIEQGIIDYSLLVGIHEHVGVVSCSESDSCSDSPPHGQHPAPRGTIPGLSEGMRSTSLAGVAGEFAGQDAMEWLSTDSRRLFFIGIIDILTSYDATKVLEYHAKALIYDSRGVSCCPPTVYAQRFNTFMQKAIC